MSESVLLNLSATDSLICVACSFLAFNELISYFIMNVLSLQASFSDRVLSIFSAVFLSCL